jgi:hypothetical protein
MLPSPEPELKNENRSPKNMQSCSLKGVINQLPRAQGSCKALKIRGEKGVTWEVKKNVITKILCDY